MLTPTAARIPKTRFSCTTTTTEVRAKGRISAVLSLALLSLIALHV